MAYDQAFADEVRALLSDEQSITEKAMFGGLAFLVDGRMALAVSGRTDLMIRVDDETQERLLDQSGIEQTVMRGRPMRGWLDVDLEALPVEGEVTFGSLVLGAVAHARTLSTT